MISLNYSKALQNSKTLTFWNKQNLTPFGKIMVIKHLSFNHLFMTIPLPDGYLIKQSIQVSLHIYGIIILIKSNGITSHRTTQMVAEEW